MMGLIQDDPMRPSGLGAKFQQLRKESCEEERPVREGKSQQIHNQGRLRVIEDLKYLRDVGRPFRATQSDDILKVRIIALRIDQAHLEVRLCQPLEQSNHDGGLPARRWT